MSHKLQKLCDFFCWWMNKKMGCIAPQLSTQSNGGRGGKKDAKKDQEHGGENWRIWNNTYWERNWKNLKGQSSIHSCGSLNSFVMGDINTKQYSSYHQENFSITFHMSTILLHPALLLQSKLQSLSHFLVLSILIDFSTDHAEQHSASVFLKWFSSFQ